MNRIDRLVSILIHLQSKRMIPAHEIAERFEISLRTVYRDIRALEEAGVPIGAEVGRGYFINEGYHLPPVMFSREEAAAMLTAEKMTEKLADNSLIEQLKSAMYKIKSVLRNSEKEYLEKLDSQIYVIEPPTINKELFPNNYQYAIHQALINKQVLEIDYYSFHLKEFNKRKVEPVGLCFYGSRWHLIAFCKLRNEYRDFRLDRIRNLLICDETFTKQHFSIQEYFPAMKESSTFKTVILRFPVSLAIELSEQKYYYGFIEEKTSPDFVEMTFITDSFYWMSQWVMSFGDKVTIVSPQEFTDFIKQRIVELSKQYL